QASVPVGVLVTRYKFQLKGQTLRETHVYMSFRRSIRPRHGTQDSSPRLKLRCIATQGCVLRFKDFYDLIEFRHNEQSPNTRDGLAELQNAPPFSGGREPSYHPPR